MIYEPITDEILEAHPRFSYEPDPLYDFLIRFERMIRRAGRNAKLFGSVAWQAHLETIDESDLPEIERAIPKILRNMEAFADDPEEMDRLEDTLEFAKRQIAHIKARGGKATKKKSKR